MVPEGRFPAFGLRFDQELMARGDVARVREHLVVQVQELLLYAASVMRIDPKKLLAMFLKISASLSRFGRFE